MSTLDERDKESLAAKMFSKTGIPLSSEDPIFALVDILQTSDEVLIERVTSACEGATAALRQAAEHIETRSRQLESMVDSYIQSRIEASNATLDIETKRLKNTAEEDLRVYAEALNAGLMRELRTYTETQCIQPLKEVLEIIPQRSWLENVWTLTACLAIGFATGFLYFDGTIRESLEDPSIRMSARTPSPPVSHKR